jgi:predicted permease
MGAGVHRDRNERVLSDLRLALRQLQKSPGFTAVAVLSLAVGIGANTAVFSLVNEILLRSLPVRNPEHLVLLRTIEGEGGRLSRAGENNGSIDPATGRNASTSFSLLIFERLRAQPSPLSDLFAFAPFPKVHLLVDGQPELDASAQLVSGNYHTGLGVPAVLGRTLTPADDAPSAAPAAVISFRYWQRRFGGSPGVLGTVVHVNRVPTTIVGVTPQGFDGALQAGESPDISVPLALHLRFQPDRAGRAQPWYWWIRVMGRLAPGATPAQVRASLEPVFQVAAREGWLAGRAPGAPPDERMPALPTLAADPGAQGEADARRQFAGSLRILQGLVALVLVAACANLANLLLARGATRRREIALRLALGAGRARIVRQLFAESLLLAAAGTGVGMVLAWWGRGLLLALRPFGQATVVLDLPLDIRVLAFTAVVAVVTALLFGLAPALRATRIDLNAHFQSGSRTLGAHSRSRVAQALMVVQIALSLVLLVSTGLFVRTLTNLDRVDAGFNRRDLLLFRIDAASAGYRREQFGALQSRVQERLERLPGVKAVTFSSVALLSRVRQNKRITVPGAALSANPSAPVNTNGLAPNFFSAMELPVALGRGFTARDDLDAPRVAVVNQAFVRTYLSGENPVGRRIGIGPDDVDQVEIVGVAADAKYTDLRQAVPATIYLPARQRLDGEANFALRLARGQKGTGDAVPYAAVASAVRAAVREIDPTLPVLDMRTQEEQVDRLHAQQLLFARLSAVFGGLALALACLGLYGLMSHAVERRTGEIGLRMALGALPAQVLRMVLRESLMLAGLGAAAGAAAAYWTGQLVASMLFGLSAADPATYLAVAVLLAVMAVLACVVPARRASHVDPLVALRSE